MGTGPNVEMTRYPSVTVPLGRLDETVPAMSVDNLAFEWAPYPCVDVALGEVLDVDDPRPDLRRFQAMLARNSAQSVRAAWGTYFTQGPAYQIPWEIPSDRMFCFSVSEVEYVDRMARYLFGTLKPSPVDFPLAFVRELYVYPPPW